MPASSKRLLIDRSDDFSELRRVVDQRQMLFLPPVRRPVDIAIDSEGRLRGEWPMSEYAWHQFLGRVDRTMLGIVRRLTSWIEPTNSPALNEPTRQWLHACSLSMFQKFRNMVPVVHLETKQVSSWVRRVRSVNYGQFIEACMEACTSIGLRPHHAMTSGQWIAVRFHWPEPCWLAPDGTACHIGLCCQRADCKKERASARWLLLAGKPDVMAWQGWRSPAWPIMKLPDDVEGIRRGLVEFRQSMPCGRQWGERLQQVAALPADRVRLPKSLCDSFTSRGWFTRIVAESESWRDWDRFRASREVWRVSRLFGSSAMLINAAEALAFIVLFQDD